MDLLKHKGISLLNTIVTLGPQGTFSEIATKQYLSANKLNLDIVYYNTINQSLNAIGKEAQLGILPIENFSEGFVNPVLDYLVNAQLYICAELLLPIQFSLVSQISDLCKIKTIYVQFVAKGQCAEYLDKQTHVNFITTESNTQSLSEISNDPTSAAVIPSHLLESKSFTSVVENITDYKDNQTRFLLLSNDNSKYRVENFMGDSADFKTSIIILFHDDYPGYLEGVLRKFTEHGINLTSIVSRPTRQRFGKYHFFIDLEGHIDNLSIKKALYEVQQRFKVKVLGSYLKS
jgi:prephenate dehydratase